MAPEHLPPEPRGAYPRQAAWSTNPPLNLLRITPLGAGPPRYLTIQSA